MAAPASKGAGSVDSFDPVADLWHSLKRAVTYYLELERGKIAANVAERQRDATAKVYKASAIYVCVSLRAMQAVDFGYLTGPRCVYTTFLPKFVRIVSTLPSAYGSEPPPN